MLLRYMLYLFILASLVLIGMSLFGPIGVVVAVFIATAALFARVYLG